MCPDKEKCLETYADADFSGNWSRENANKDSMTVKSRAGVLITFANCPVLWVSNLQTIISLSATDADYVALSQSLRETITIIKLLKKLNILEYSTYSSTPTVYYKAFEDNSGALELANTPKMHPRTKHINLAYHHLRDYVRRREIIIHPIGTSEHLADTFTKPISQNPFCKFRKAIMGW